MIILFLGIVIFYTISIRYNFKMILKYMSPLLVIYYLFKFVDYDMKFNSLILFLVGILIGLIWMAIGSKILKYPFKISFLCPCMDKSNIMAVLIEEVIWRGTLQRYYNNNYPNNMYLIIIIFIIAGLFSYSHNIKQQLAYSIEFYLFSFLLAIALILFNNIFITIGIHLCRNNFILNASKEYIE